MRRAFLLAFFGLAGVMACSPSDPPPASKPAVTVATKAVDALTLGEPITAQPVALTQIAKDPRPYAGKVVATSGTVTAVCQHMGCWMELKDDSGEAHVVLSGHKFFVPKTASGRKARVQAKVLETKDGDECTQEAAQQTGKAVAKLQLEATGVELD